MPVYEFKCPDEHVTTKVVKLSEKLPPFVPCAEIMCSMKRKHTKPGHPYSGHPIQSDCRCRKRAKRVEVYKIGVQGDLPTRGAF